MSAIDRHIPNRRVAARNAADRRRKLLLVGLFALLAVVLAFQLPNLLSSSGSSSSTTSPSNTAPATSPPAAAGSHATGAATAVPAQGARAIGHLTSHDPFMPVIGQSAPASTSSSSPASASASVSTPASASAPASTSAPAPVSGAASGSAPASVSTSQPVSHSTPLTAVPTASTHSGPATGQPAVATPAAPTAAVIWANGTRQVVGVGHTFHVGDATFKLAAVDDTSMHLQVPDGSFTGGKHTITIRKGREVILENNATGVLYTLRFAGGTSSGS